MSRGVIPLLIAGALVAGSATTATAATTPTDLFVSKAPCSDAGPGSQADPFCTIQAAAAVALPGQTIHVGNGQYDGPVTITRSGEQGAPITFVKADGAANVLVLPHGGAGFSVTGAHDVVISGFQVSSGVPAVAVSDSTRITVEHNELTASLPTSTGAGVVVSGASSDVTVSRNEITGNLDGGVSVGSGATGTTVTTNVILNNGGTAVAVDDAPDTVITSNTVFENCGTGITLTGSSTGATVENNILNNDSDAGISTRCAGTPVQSELTVAADSTTGTTADYNVVANPTHDFIYSWAGVARTSAAAFNAATGQAAHDINTDPRIVQITGQLAATSPAIDSADADAPGELTVDQLGNPRVDDPLVPDTGVGVADRGAVELADPFDLGTLLTTPTKAPVGASVTASVDVTNPWSTVLSFSFDFGDGTAPVTTSTPSATHTYTDTGVHKLTVTATTPSGVRQVRSTTVQIAPVAPLVAHVHPYQTDRLEIAVDTSATTDSWQITDYAIDFGDGTAVAHSAIPQAVHTYAAPGTYTVTSTVTDFAGNTDVATQKVTVASGYFPLQPVRVLDTRDGTGVRPGKLGAGGVVSLKLAGTHGIPATGVRAVVLNVTAVSPTTASFLTVYPDGTTRPVASSLNYVAGQTVPNLVTVPVGADGNVDFFNHVGTVDVVADLQGYYADRPDGGGEFLTALQEPDRLLDTRNTNGGTFGKPIGAGGIAQVFVGNVDPDAQETVAAVVVNVTVTAPTTTSFLTVYPDTTTRPTASNLNFTKGQTISNLVTVPVSFNGVVDFFNHVGTAHVIVDLEGYYTHPFAFDPPSAATSFTPLPPTRILDTRTTTGGHHAAIGPRGRATLQVAGTAGIPADATSVVLNLTGVSPTQATFVTAVPDGAFDPGTSDVNIAAGQTLPNMVVVPIGANGKIDFFNNAGQINVVADVTGYFTD